MTYVPNPTDASNPIGSVSAGTADIEFQALKLYQARFLSGRNLFINGAFNINQLNETYNYGVGQAAVAGYTVDGWAFEDGFGNTAIQQIPDSIGGNQLQMTSDATTASGMFKQLFQSIEALKCSGCIEGTIVTVSGFLNIPSNLGLVVTVQLNAANALNDFGAITGVGTSDALTLTAGQLTFFNTQITLTGNALQGLQVAFVFTGEGIVSASTYAYRLQAEFNNFQTPFEVKGYAQDLVECKRFLQIWAVGTDRYVLGPNSTLTDSYSTPTEMLGTITFTHSVNSGTAPTTVGGGTIQGQTYAECVFNITGSGSQHLAYSLKIELNAQL